jgi:restriction system protein
LQFPEYLEYKGQGSRKAEPSESLGGQQDPRERLEDAYEEIRRASAQDILTKVKGCSPEFFERLIVALLVKMKYGGSSRDAGQSVGKSGDGGIDGVIKEDVLGLDTIYLQAKRYESANVPIGAVRDFVGALVGKRARKGVLITTSGFGDEARRFAQTIEGKTLVLIDGVTLADLMLEHELGFTVTDEYKIGRIDDSYFEDETSP